MMSAHPFSENQLRLSLPQEKTFAVWLTHDVDRVRKTWFHAFYYALKDRRVSHLTSLFSSVNPYWNFERIMAIEDRYQARSTFFFLNETMKASVLHPSTFVLAKGRYDIREPAIAEIIRELDDKGWEIGVHGSYHSFENPDLLREEKRALEEIVGHPVTGIRQHYLNLKVPETWQIQRDLGFTYDASFGSNDDIGWRGQAYYPFRPFDGAFTVYPLTIMDSALFAKHADPDEAWKDCLGMVEEAHSRRTLLMLLWHQRVFDERDFPHHTRLYERLILECQKRNALFCTGKDIHNYL